MGVDNYALLTIGKKTEDVNLAMLHGINVKIAADDIERAVDNWIQNEPGFIVIITNNGDEIIGFMLSNTEPYDYNILPVSELFQAISEKSRIFQEWFKTEPEIFLIEKQSC